MMANMEPLTQCSYMMPIISVLVVIHPINGATLGWLMAL